MVLQQFWWVKPGETLNPWWLTGQKNPGTPRQQPRSRLQGAKAWWRVLQNAPRSPHLWPLAIAKLAYKGYNNGVYGRYNLALTIDI